MRTLGVLAALLAASGCSVIARNIDPVWLAQAATPVLIASATAGATGAHVGVEVGVGGGFFGIPLAGSDDIVFVLDRSGSMGSPAVGVSGKAIGLSENQALVADLGGMIVNDLTGGHLPSKLEAAKTELVRAIRALPDGTRIGIVWFDDSIKSLSPQLVTLHRDVRPRIERFIAGIDTGGTTAAVPALDAAYAMDPQRVVLLSDGLANTGGDGGDLMARARHQIVRGVRFDTVGLGLDQDTALMRRLAGESGGLAIER